MFGFGSQSLATRIAIGKACGMAFGLLGFLTLPYLSPDSDPLLRWGVLGWYITVGAVIGGFGVMTWHPALELPMPWWLRGPVIGGWMNFVLVLMAYDALAKIMTDSFGRNGPITSPFWFIVEGVLFGLVVAYLAARYGGEGRKTLDELD